MHSRTRPALAALVVALAACGDARQVASRTDGLSCDRCHGLPPAATHAGVSPDLAGCVRCHASTVDAGGELIPGGRHMSGQVDARHDDPWMVPTSAGFHGASAWQGLSACQGCHGENLEGGRGMACAACHAASGGDLSCTSCHRALTGDGATRSSHVAAAAPNSNCRTCHETSQQEGGHYRLPAPGGSFADDMCIACHTGQSETLGGRTPPPLLGWAAGEADFHGARAGAGSGGTLKAPYVRGQGALPCTDCHDHHASANAFLFAGNVNGTEIPAGAIDRAGVGAEVLCNSCHEGERHASCLGCHAGLAGDPNPPGDPCFWCHGHEGIVRWYPPVPEYAGCDACHYLSVPSPEHIAPTITGPTVSGITWSSATIRWTTDESATSYVEYGVSTARQVAGNYDLTTQHALTLTGLAPGTTYVWRVRTSDSLRNVSWSELRTFTTTPEGGVPTPDVAAVNAGTTRPNTAVSAALLWYPVAAPSGTAVEYEVQLASDPAFTYLVNADLARVDDTLATGNSGWIAGTPTTDEGYPARPALKFDVTLTNLPQDDCGWPAPAQYWFRVRARDQTGEVSEWSATASCTAMAWDPYCE